MELYCEGTDLRECLDWETPLRPEDRRILPWDRTKTKVVCVGCLEDALEAEKQRQAEEYELNGYPEDALDTAVTPWYAHN